MTRVEHRLPRLAEEQRLRQGGGAPRPTTTAPSTTCSSPPSPTRPATGRWPGGPCSTRAPSASTRRSPADGSQPQELARTRSWHYSTFDLVAYTRLAAIGRHVGVDLWAYRGPGRTEPVQGGRLSAARRDRGRRLAAPGAGVPPVRGERRRARGRRRGGQARRGRLSRSWRRRPAVTCGRCVRRRSSWTRSRADQGPPSRPGS